MCNRPLWESCLPPLASPGNVEADEADVFGHLRRAYEHWP